VLAFPDNQYMSQEPGTNAEIKKYVSGSGTHTYAGHPKATWTGTAVPPAILMAKTNGYSGTNPKPPPWDPHLKGEWCNVTSATACKPSSAECCSKNEVVWKWLAKTVPTVPACKGSYPPSWNFAGKYLIDQCGRLVGAAGNSASEPWTTVAPMVSKLLATTPKC
jgi:glutathione peroxidase-family protein